MHDTDEMCVLRVIAREQDGQYGCGFGKLIKARPQKPRTPNPELGRERASLAVDQLVRDGLACITVFLGMEMFHVTEKGQVVASHLQS